MGFTLQREVSWFRALPWSVTMTFAQMRQQIQLLLFRNRRVRPATVMPASANCSNGGYAHHCGWLNCIVIVYFNPCSLWRAGLSRASQSVYRSLFKTDALRRHNRLSAQLRHSISDLIEIVHR